MCERVIKNSGSNWTRNANGDIVHKKCPSDKEGAIAVNEKQAYTRLRDRLLFHAVNNPRGFIAEKPMNFSRAMQVVKQMHDREYSYDDILYALEETVKQQEGFWGIKAVDNKIDMLIAQRKSNQQKIEKLTMEAEKAEMVKGSEVDKVVNLSHLINDDYDW